MWRTEENRGKASLARDFFLSPVDILGAVYIPSSFAIKLVLLHLPQCCSASENKVEICVGNIDAPVLQKYHRHHEWSLKRIKDDLGNTVGTKRMSKGKIY